MDTFTYTNTLPIFEPGSKVEVWMGFDTFGIVISSTASEVQVSVDDPMCGAGLYAFEAWDPQNRRFTTTRGGTLAA